MRPAASKIILALTIAIAVALGWWLSSVKRPLESTMIAPGPETMATEPKQSDAPPEIVQPFAQTPYLGLKDPRWIERRRLRVVDPAYQWRTPIEFFGKVIDERGAAVAGALIEMAWTGTAEKYGGDGVEKRTLTSDTNGMFSLTGAEGKGMTVLVSKEGYYRRRSWNGGSFEYAGFWEPTFIEPDPRKPVIFHLVKRPAAEPTYHIGGRIFLEPPVLETHLDLLSPSGQTTAPADLYIRINRPMGASYHKPFDWHLTIEGRNGAEIVETADEFMIHAPAEGYKPQLVRDFKNPTGNAEQKVRFYVRSKVRKIYAAVEFEIAAYRQMNGTEPASIIIEATVNPNDSPNVEYDPEKDIRKIARQSKR